MKKEFLIATLLIILLLLFWTFNDYEISNNYKIEKSESFCEELESPEMKKTCLAVIKKDFSMCEGIPYFETYCYDTVSKVIEDPSLCEKLTDYSQYSCYHSIAKIKKDPSLCEKVGWHDRCYWDLAKITDDSSLCGNIEIDCERYQCLAGVTRNSSFCEIVPDADEKKACFAKLAFDVSECKVYVPRLGETLSVSNCMYSIAKTTQNISVCWGISSKQEKWTCLVELSEDESICDKADSAFWKDFCLLEVFIYKINKVKVEVV